MGLTSFLMGLYRWDALSDGNLIEMKRRVENGIPRAQELACGTGFMARSAQKDLDKLLDSQRKIDAEMAKRGLSAW